MITSQPTTPLSLLERVWTKSELKSIHQNISYLWDFYSHVYPFPKQASLTQSPWVGVTQSYRLTSLTKDTLGPKYLRGLKGENAVAFMNGVQVISIAEGTMKPIVVHLCQHDLESAEANQNPLNRRCPVQLSCPVSRPGLSCHRTALLKASRHRPGARRREKGCHNGEAGVKAARGESSVGSASFLELSPQRNALTASAQSRRVSRQQVCPLR